MHILRLTASLLVVLSPVLIAKTVFSQASDQTSAQNRGLSFVAGTTRFDSNAASSATTIAQATTDGQPVGIQSTSTSTPGTNLSTPGSTLQSPGRTLQTPGTTLPTPGTTLQTPGSTLQSPGAGLPTAGTTQTLDGRTNAGQPLPGTTGAGAAATPGTTQIINGQPVNGQLGINGQSVNGQTIQTTPSTTGATGATQTSINGQPVGTTTPTTGVTPAGSNAAGSQSNPGSVLNPPQIIQGAGTVAAPAAQPANTTLTPPTSQRFAPGTAPAPSAAATRTTAPGTPQVSPTQLQPGQGALDASLQQATCAQNWQQAIRLVNTAIASAPANEAGYRAQLVSYRSRLQTLQSKGVRAPNWAQQCRGGSVANASGR